jgi:anti-sigma B factor antagonist
LQLGQRAESLANRNVVIDRSEPGVAIVALTGEHETFTAEKLRHELHALIGEGRAVVVDLSAATFLDSAVVGVILESRGQAQDRGLKFALVMDDNTGPAVQRLFELTGLGSFLPIVSSRDAALAG